MKPFLCDGYLSQPVAIRIDLSKISGTKKMHGGLKQEQARGQLLTSWVILLIILLTRLQTKDFVLVI